MWIRLVGRTTPCVDSCRRLSYGRARSPSKEYECGQFSQWTRHCKKEARKSIVVEDRTRSGSIWFRSQCELDQLLGTQTRQVFRWRVSAANGTGRKFVLLQFATFGQQQEALGVLQKPEASSVRNNLVSVDNWPVTRPHKYFLQLSSKGVEGKCKIFSVDREGGTRRLVGHFENHTLSRKPAKKSFSVGQVEHTIRGEESLSELQRRIRFVLLVQLEDLVQNKIHFSRANLDSRFFELIPFGSDVSGFGNSDSDLDICVVNSEDRHCYRKVNHRLAVPLLAAISRNLGSRSKRPDVRFGEVERIFRAFIPIIKCRSPLMPTVNIDISVDSQLNSGVQMAAYLHHCSQCHLVRPFILLLKCWAKHHRMIQPAPGHWFSSFQMTMLGIGFLQHLRLIPSIEEWKQTSDMPEYEASPGQAERVMQLTQEFFQFMLQYNFWNNAFDLLSGRSDLAKPDWKRSACYVMNPFAPSLNICKTVSEHELERFLSLCKQSHEVMSKENFRLEDLFLGYEDRIQQLEL